MVRPINMKERNHNMNSKGYIQVWDLLVRISHWSLVIFVMLAFITGDEKSKIHIYIGNIVILLISIRFLWGFVGCKYARFSNFICKPSSAIQYIKELIGGSPRYYIGHNPAAGWMVVFLLLILSVVCATGHLAYRVKGKELTAHQFAIVGYAYADSGEEDDDEETDYKHSKKNEFWEEIHEGASGALIGLIILHIIGALVSSKLHQENLVIAMVTGRKEKKA